MVPTPAAAAGACSVTPARVGAGLDRFSRVPRRPRCKIVGKEDAVSEEMANVPVLKRVEREPVLEALEQFPYGLYIIGSRTADGRELNGMMADWVTQASFQPRLVLVSLENDSTTLRYVRSAGVFSVNLLRADGKELARRFCQPHEASKVKGRSERAAGLVYNKLDGVDFYLGTRTACPILEEALVWLECRLTQEVAAGDHTLVLGEVLDGGVLAEGEPLTSMILGWHYSG
jgi:flavin reductase (DIM6/NTAB) family NADH-FMN oxidoreductase RutF